MVYISCVTIALTQSEFVLLVAATLEHPASVIFLAQGGIDWCVLFLLRKYRLCFRGPNVSPVVSRETIGLETASLCLLCPLESACTCFSGWRE